jgi:hypothetical protein
MKPPIGRIAVAIAVAEGFGIPDAIPTRANNPGDLCLGDRFNLGTLGADITIFPKADSSADIEDPEDGWASLYREVRAILDGTSEVYEPNWTIEQIAEKWTATEPQDWASNVAESLGVLVTTQINQVT